MAGSRCVIFLAITAIQATYHNPNLQASNTHLMETMLSVCAAITESIAPALSAPGNEATALQHGPMYLTWLPPLALMLLNSMTGYAALLR